MQCCPIAKSSIVRQCDKNVWQITRNQSLCKEHKSAGLHKAVKETECVEKSKVVEGIVSVQELTGAEEVICMWNNVWKTKRKQWLKY